ncbi:14770_t:CDS:2, partial [Funneliformis geosporum]
NSGNGSNKRRTGLITTYVATLPQSSRDVLSQAGIKISRISSKPTFDYACFLKGLQFLGSTRYILDSINYWNRCRTWKGYSDNPILRKRIFIVIQELMKHFFRKSKVLYKLNAGSGIIVPEILANVITEIPEAKKVLSKLRTFTCGSTVNTAKFIRHIQQLEVHPYEDLSELSKLISVHKFLSSISMEENHTSGKYLGPPTLANFVNLEELILSAFDDQDYPRSKWIQLTGLQQVIIHSHKLFDPNNSGLLIANIAQFCPDIILYEGPILQDNRREFTKLLDSYNHLRSLHLRPSKGIPDALNQESSSTNQRNSEGKVDFDAIFKEITISDGWMISAEAFEKFLESRVEMSRPVCFYWNPTVQFKGQMEKFVKRIIDMESASKFYVFLHGNLTSELGGDKKNSLG